MTNKERPVIKINNKTEIHLEIELFQNKVLRPILKMQHDLILKTFHNHINKLSIDWNQLKHIKKVKCVIDQLSKNLQLKNLIIGIIVGHLNEQESNQYFNSNKEYNKRIIQMSIQRIQSTINM